MRSPLALYRRIRLALRELDDREIRHARLSTLMDECDAKEAADEARGIYHVSCPACEGTGMMMTVEHAHD